MKPGKFIGRYFHDFLGLLYPEFCAACGKNLVDQEKVLCTQCLYELPRTNFHKQKDNALDQIFWGRVEILQVSSFFYFLKGSKYRKLIHQLKYKGRSDIGFELGKLYGAELALEPAFIKPDLILPVPLHPKKERKRGYNQSLMIAKGLAEMLSVKVEPEMLIRKIYTQTQTKKARYERWENVEEVFGVNHPKKIAGKHLLLVDDILTTGATLEGCAQVLHKAADVKISIATLGFASQ